MAKSGKSSASSATRKKQAAKAAKKAGVEPPTPAAGKGKQPAQRGQKKDKKDKKQPKKKVFIPPPKPPQPAPDPLDALGLAAHLPPDLVVHLRKASKKDVLTRQRALEGLQAWIRGENGEEDGAAELSEEERISALALMLPSWVHIFPRLSISPTRRLRLLTAQILSELLSISDVRSELLFSPQYAEALIGPWAVLAWDTDRQTSRIAREAWDKSSTWQTDSTDKLNLHDQLSPLLAHLSVLLLTLSPSSVLAHNAPHIATPAVAAGSGAAPSIGPDSSLRDAKNRDDTVEEDVAATDRRLAAGALGSLAWIVSSHPAPLPAEQLERLLTSPSLWSALAPVRFETGSSEDEQMPFLGLASPPTRQRAWDLLKALTAADAELVKTHVLSIVAPIALVSAWEERDQLVQKNMLVSLLPLLRALPETWRTADAALGGEYDAEEDSDDEADEEDDDTSGDDEEGEEGGTEGGRKRKELASASPSFAAFERWIQSGCGGAPDLCFPTVVLFLATAPATIVPVSHTSSARFLGDFSKALHGGTLDTRPAMAAYSSAFCDCVLFLGHRLLKAQGSDAGSDRNDASSLVADQLGSLWKDLVLGGAQEAEADAAVKRADELVSERALTPVVDCIAQIAGMGDGGAHISVSVLQRICADTRDIAHSDVVPLARLRTLLTRALPPLQRLHQNTKLSDAAHSALAEFILDLANSAISRLSDTDASQSKTAVLTLSDLLKRFPAVFAADDKALSRTIAAGSDEIPALFAKGTVSARETITVLAALSAVSERTAAAMRDIWPRMVQVVLQLPDAATQAGAVVELLPAVRALGKTGGTAEDGGLPPALRTALSDIAVDLTQKLCEGDAAGTRSAASFPQAELSQAIGGIVALPATHIDLEPLGEAMALLTSLIEHVGFDALSQAAPSSPTSPIDSDTGSPLPYALDALASWLSGSSSADAKQLMHAGESWSVVPIVFALAQPKVGGGDGDGVSSNAITSSTRSNAAKVWAALRSDPEAVASVDNFVQKQFSETLLAVGDLVELVSAAAAGVNGKGLGRLCALLPSSADMATTAEAVVQQADSLPILAVVDQLVPLSPAKSNSETSVPSMNRQGFSAYVRNVLVHLQLCEDDRTYRNHSAWLLPHLILLGVITEDRLLYGSAWRSALALHCDAEVVQDILDRSVKAATAILSALATTLSSDWHTTITADLLNSKTSASDSAGLAEAIRQTYSAASSNRSPTQHRIFARLLSGVLTYSSAEAQDGERWLQLARQVQARDSRLAQAIFVSAKSLSLGSPLYERLCNESAARLAGVPPSKANTEGIALLGIANAIAPPTNSEYAFIPKQRAIFLLQALQKWMASDEDLDEKINAHLANLFIHLAPIVQDMSGSHLDFFFDVIETNLDVAVETIDEDDGIPAVYHTLKLLGTAMDLATANATFREIFEERQAGIAELLSKLFTGLAPSASSSESLHSVPREICTNLLVELIHRIPEAQRASLVSNPDVLTTLLSHRVQQVQVISYRLLSAYIHERVQAAIVEAAVDKEGSAAQEIVILPALVNRASQSVDDVLAHVDDISGRHNIFGFLLAWLAILDHFEESSLQLKSVYLAQLQKSDMATSSLLPAVFALMASTQHERPFDAGKVGVDEIFLDDLELSRIFTLQALAGHVFYRALINMPGAVRDWWRSIKNRQVSVQVASFTSRHCSPLLAAKEFAHLRRPDALAQLQDDTLAVRVLSGTNEVIATYTIDEHPMEIGIRLPGDYPLHGAEIRDIKRVGGVSERQWRAWLLAVQQIISGRNGLVFDALMLFKKNAEAKFAGFEGRECTICYSIISPIDESLPTKPCKTCKNAFHSSCLLRWFVQSGSSTCPLCRSII
ncbi:hypothetical protein OC842_004094 [Tilletia horrida]|uniref:E3 ubiquitin-protein ligase listerin n=1 Tax=Tilletia horrida TaxID=155126 RepID=A0AAN6GAJ3_9BASI|nr:hypothetical protein OC842_004094 [Tilletia horrida]